MKKRNNIDIPIVAEEESVYIARLNGSLSDGPFRPKLIDLFVAQGV